MAEDIKNTNGEAPKLTPDEAERLVRALGLIFSNSFLYGPEHGVTRKALTDSYALFGELTSRHPEILFNITEEGLLVDGNPIDQKNPLVRMFVSHLGSLEINSFSLLAGMSPDKFEQLVKIMNRKPEDLKKAGGFTLVVAGSDIQSVRVKKITYQQVAEDEVVVNKDNVDTEGGGGTGPMDAKTMEEVIAFLKGESKAEEDKAVTTIQQVSSNTTMLADMVMETVKSISQEPAAGAAGATGAAGAATGGGEAAPSAPAPTSGSQMAERVVDSMRRIFDVLMKDPSIKTQKGKKNVAKMLQLLQEQIFLRMEKALGTAVSNVPGVHEMIEGAVGEMSDELKMDALADEYVKKRVAARGSEDKILRYLKVKGIDSDQSAEIREKLTHGGLTVDEWNDLLLRSGMAKPGQPLVAEESTGTKMAAIGYLAALLVKMEEKAKGVGAPPGGPGDPAPTEDLAKTLGEVDREVAKLVTETEKKIDELVKEAKEEPAGATEKEKLRNQIMSRKKLIELLAEIVQELCQPMAVINCSVDMMRSQSLGTVTEQQKEMLDLAFTSGERVNKLIQKLLEIAGVPTTLRPDEATTSSLY